MKKDIQDNRKTRIQVLQAHSLRELVNLINDNNEAALQNLEGAQEILREDIISIMKEYDTYFLLYYK